MPKRRQVIPASPHAGGPSLVGKDIRLLPQGLRWQPSDVKVIDWRENSKQSQVQYEDGVVQWLRLAAVPWDLKCDEEQAMDDVKEDIVIETFEFPNDACNQDTEEDSEPCRICGQDDEAKALLCDGCDGVYHLACVKPRLKKVPQGQWFCSKCKASYRRKAKTPVAVTKPRRTPSNPIKKRVQKRDALDQQRKRQRVGPVPGDEPYVTNKEYESLKTIGKHFNVETSDLLKLNRGRIDGLTVTAILWKGTTIYLPAGVDPKANPWPSRTPKHETPARVHEQNSVARRLTIGTPLEATVESTPSKAEYDSDSEDELHMVPKLKLPQTPVVADGPKCDLSSHPQPTDNGLTPYEMARHFLNRSSSPDSLECREEERKNILTFVEDRIESETPGSLYISGKPGTGKTATISNILDELQQNYPQLKIVQTNCMTVTSPKFIYNEVLASLSGKQPHFALKPDSAKDLLKKQYLVGKPMAVIVLDEIDQLETQDKQVLYEIFSWTKIANDRRLSSNVILIGIANGLDLTKRVLPYLPNHDLSPQEMNFLPYDKDQLIRIIKARIARVPTLPGGKPVLDPNAIIFCARKVTSFNGDLRNCLDMCSRAVELAAKSPAKNQTLIMKNLFTEIYGSDIVQSIRALPLHQRVILCCLFRDRSEVITVATLSSAYTTACLNKNIAPLQQEFSKILDMLKCSSLVQLQVSRRKTSELREARVTLCCMAEDIKVAFKDDSVLGDLLEEAEIPSSSESS